MSRTEEIQVRWGRVPAECKAIANAPEDIAWLLAEVDRLRSREAEQERVRQRFSDAMDSNARGWSAATDRAVKAEAERDAAEGRGQEAARVARPVAHREPAHGRRAMTICWEPRDVWVGLFWDRRADGLHLYVCLVPCVVIHWLVEDEPLQ